MTRPPLQILAIKYCDKELKDTELSERMAAASLTMEGCIRGVTCDEASYDSQIKSKGKGYKTTAFRCLNYRVGSNKRVKPDIMMLLLLQGAIKCKFEELLDIFHPEYKLLNLSLSEPSQEITEDETSPIRKIPIKQINKEFAQKIKVQTIIEKEFGYKLLEYKVEVEYTKCSPNKNTLKVMKTYILVPLVDDIREIKFFDYYRCLRNNKGDIEEPGYSKELFSIQPKKHLGSDENSISLIFHEVLKKGQPVKFFLSYFYEDILDSDIGFQNFWILHPTENLILKVTPDEPEVHERARFCKHWFKRCPLGVEKKVEKSTVISLVKGQKYFYKEVPNPNLFIACGLYWHRDYLL